LKQEGEAQKGSKAWVCHMAADFRRIFCAQSPIQDRMTLWENIQTRTGKQQLLEISILVVPTDSKQKKGMNSSF